MSVKKTLLITAVCFCFLGVAPLWHAVAEQKATLLPPRIPGSTPAAPVALVSSHQQTVNSPISSLLSSLREKIGNGAQIQTDTRTHAVSFIGSGMDGLPIHSLGGLQQMKPTTVTNQFMKEYGVYFGLRDPLKELAIVNTVRDQLGMEHVRYNQVHDGVPVFGAQTIVHLKSNNEVNAVNSTLVPDVTLDVQPTLTQTAAEERARGLWVDQGRPTNETIGHTKLYILNPGLLQNKPDTATYLTWRVELSSEKPLARQFFFIDAHSGEPVLQIEGLQSAIHRHIWDCSLGDGDCYLDTLWLGYTYGRSEGKSARGANPWYGTLDTDNLYGHLGNLYNYYSTMFSRNGANNLGGMGDGTPTFLTTDTVGLTYIDDFTLSPGDSGSCPNAFFNSNSIHFCRGFTTLDITGHEYAHGVNYFSILDSYGDPNGLTYSGESGALNESNSDVFGEAIEYYVNGTNDWLIGEDLGAASRNMANPASYYYNLGSGTKPYPDRMYASGYYCGSSDGGGVHINSSVPNHAAYLMAIGGTFNGCTITGIGREKEERIFYRAETTYYTPSTDFSGAYTALIASCADLYGATSSDCVNVQKALQAVEMDQDGACSSTERVEPACTVPAIFSTYSAMPNGYYKAGDVIDIIVTFTTPVTSTGSVTVNLNTGGSCSFTASNSRTGTCSYTVAAGENASDLTTTTITGTLANQYGNALVNFTPTYDLGQYKNIVIDTTPPTGTITINDGATATNTGRVTLTVSASDTYGISYATFANGGQDWAAWEAYTTSRAWDIPTTIQGSTTVYAQFLDRAGNQMTTAASASIIYDTTVPVSTATPTAGWIVKGRKVTLTANETATVYYTTNGTVPTTNSTVYTAPISISTSAASTAIRYFAVDTAGNSETYHLATYRILKPAAIITVPGPGKNSQVKSFTYNGTARATPKNLFPFGTTYTGGGHLAACDVDGDKYDEIIAGSGTGQEPWIKVYRASGVLITRFMAYASNVRAGVYVACGDLNGDGKAEIVTGVPEGFGPHVRVFSGLTGKATLTSGFFAYAKTVRTGIRVATGDLDGDGKEEIICGTGSGAGAHVRTFSGTGQLKFTPGFFVYEKTDRTGINVAAGDVNGDGNTEIITGSARGRVGEVKIYTRSGTLLGKFSPYGTAYKDGVKVGSGDLDADGTDEIVTGTGLTSTPQVKSFRMKGAALGSLFAYDKTFRGGVDIAAGLID